MVLMLVCLEDGSTTPWPVDASLQTGISVLAKTNIVFWMRF